MNVDQDHQKIVTISASTKTPLEYVPYLMLYFGGRPIAQYQPDEQHPEANLDKMKMFLIQQTKSLKSGGAANASREDSQHDATAANAIPKYSIGIPGNKKRVCYFNYTSAYPQATPN
jgi:hypothetical protein